MNMAQFIPEKGEMKISKGVTVSTVFTIESWAHFTALSASEDNVVLAHAFFWKLVVEPSTQMWVLYFYSTSEGSYHAYSTLKLVPLNSWLYVAVQFSYNKASVVTYPSYTVTSFNIDPTVHAFASGSSTDFSMGGVFTGYIHSVKYRNSCNDLSESNIVYPTLTTTATSSSALLFYYIFTYGNHISYLGKNGAFSNLRSGFADYAQFTTKVLFADAPLLCNSTAGYIGNTCQGRSHTLILFR